MVLIMVDSEVAILGQARRVIDACIVTVSLTFKLHTVLFIATRDNIPLALQAGFVCMRNLKNKRFIDTTKASKHRLWWLVGDHLCQCRPARSLVPG
jgi:hypothetical protein